MGFLKVNGVFDNNLMPSKEEYCVYSLLDESRKAVYVGQSSNLRGRIFNHLSGKKKFCYIEWSLCDKEDMNNIEAARIVRAKSALNKRLPKNDLYMSGVAARIELSGKIKAILDGVSVFGSSNSVNFITRNDFDKFTALADKFIAALEAELPPIKLGDE
jgi:hypothetical protein